jgi:hypothetical protein
VRGAVLRPKPSRNAHAEPAKTNPTLANFRSLPFPPTRIYRLSANHARHVSANFALASSRVAEKP